MASDVLRNGGVIIFPTETVYGIGADSRNIAACQRIYSIKNRPRDNPFIVHVDSIESMEQIAVIPKKYQDSISRLTPGPITFILEKKEDSIFSTGLSTIGVRIPSNEIAKELLRISKTHISAPSANISGKPSITRSRDAIESFTGKVDFILTGEDSDIGFESTVVDLTGEIPILLRMGGISFNALIQVFPLIKKLDTEIDYAKPASPGLKYRHYAPECEVILLQKEISIRLTKDTAYIGFKPKREAGFSLVINSNLEYMHHLYSFFIDCDQKKIRKAFCEYPIQDEFEEVIVNRIQKAALK